MTLVLDHPLIADRRGRAPVADPFAACQPWCTRDPDWHDTDRAVHDSDFVVVPTHTAPCTRHGDGPAGGEVWLALEREDQDGRQGATHLYLAPTSSDPGARCEEAHLDLDEADTLADRIRDLVARARGAKRAIDLRVGDRIVWGGVEQNVVITLADSECCCCPTRCGSDDNCPGSVAIETDASGDGNWIGDHPFSPDALVPVRTEVPQ
jgi:hypothetical protein